MLRHFINETLLIENPSRRPPPEASNDDVFGEYLFGNERDDVKPPEIDTTKEKKLQTKYRIFFMGKCKILKKMILNYCKC